LKHVRFCILGAGPSGLAFAAALKRAGCDSFVLLEKEPDAGGLCRSAVVDGAPLDIGGGHFLSTTSWMAAGSTSLACPARPSTTSTP
jgi:protoporphyrinogen oxidase